MAAWPTSFTSSSWGGTGTNGSSSFTSLSAASSFTGGGGTTLGGSTPFSGGQAAFGSASAGQPSLFGTNSTPHNPFSGQSSSVLGSSLLSSSPFGAPSSSLFGSASSFGSSALFGSSSSSPFGSSSSTPFGSSSSSPFGSSSLSPFGSSCSSSSSASSSFGSSTLFGSSASSPFGSSSSPFGSTSSSLFGASGTSSNSLFGGSLLGGGAGGNTAPPSSSSAPTHDAGQSAKSEGEKYIDAWKNLEAAAKGGVWPFSSFGVSEGERLFAGLDISPEEHRFLFYQRNPADWPGLAEQIVTSQLQQLQQFHGLVREKAVAERLAFEAPPPSVDFLRPFLAANSLSLQSAPVVAPQLDAVQALSSLGASNPPEGPGTGTRPSEDAARAAARDAAFSAPQFEPGKIPDVPPPREVC